MSTIIFDKRLDMHIYLRISNFSMIDKSSCWLRLYIKCHLLFFKKKISFTIFSYWPIVPMLVVLRTYTLINMCFRFTHLSETKYKICELYYV